MCWFVLTWCRLAATFLGRGELGTRSLGYCLPLNPRSVKNGVTRNTPPGMHIVRIPFRGIQSDSEIRVNLVRTSGNVTVKFERHMVPMAMWARMMQAMKLS